MLARQLVAATGDEGVAPEELAVSWNALLRYASQQARARKKGSSRFALILDEFPLLVMQTPDLPSILQAWWDREGVHSPLFVVLCGSQLSAMAALGAESAPLFGRFNAGIFHIDPLHYEDVACFYEGGRHYRFIAPLASDLQFSDPAAVYAAHVAPRLADYMGWFVFEEVCEQWLQRHAKQRLGLTIRQMARYWSRDGRTEINIVAELDNGTFLFAECKWRTDRVMRLSDLSALQAKVAGLPEARRRKKPSYILFALGGFSPELLSLATDPDERLYLVADADLLSVA